MVSVSSRFLWLHSVTAVGISCWQASKFEETFLLVLINKIIMLWHYALWKILFFLSGLSSVYSGNVNYVLLPQVISSIFIKGLSWRDTDDMNVNRYSLIHSFSCSENVYLTPSTCRGTGNVTGNKTDSIPALTGIKFCWRLVSGHEELDVQWRGGPYETHYFSVRWGLL